MSSFRIMIAGTGSGCGKTTMTCALLAALKNQGHNVVSFKCGPDYIDPTFHRQATEIDCFNLDPFLMGEDGVRESLGFHSQNRDIAVIEGVMGFYDGIGQGSEASSHHLSRLTQTPVLLVVNTKGKGVSICAEIQGFQHFENNNIVGVILNRTKTGSIAFYTRMIEEKTSLKVVGHLPDLPEAHLESRHLGLIPAEELPDVKRKISCLAEAARKTFDFKLLFEIASKVSRQSSVDCGEVPPSSPALCKTANGKRLSFVTIYVARDDAFCFHYADNHRILESYGAELKFFSPLTDSTIPEDADGLILWGGYPELHAARLATNESFKQSVRKRYEKGMPIFAECGGFMYVQKTLVDRHGTEHAMLGIVEGNVSMTDRLQNFGYVTLTANKDNMLCPTGDRINAHSFHYSRSSNEGCDFTAAKASKDEFYPCIIATEKLFAGDPHLHFSGNKRFAAGFVDACLKYKRCKRQFEVD